MTTFLLIHGACHDGWCWDAVGKSLTRAGHIAVAPDLPCDDVTAGVNEYADTAERALGDAGRDVVVVGHSLGALTAAAIASRNEIRGLVFVAGIIGVPGKSLADLAEIDTDRDAPLEDGDFESDTAGRFRFSEVCGKRALYDDCSAELARGVQPLALPALALDRGRAL